MATRKTTKADEMVPGVPPGLYWGLPPWAFPYFGPDDPRSDRSGGKRHRWVGQVRAAGYSVSRLRVEAKTDPGYQRFLAHAERKRRLEAE